MRLCYSFEMVDMGDEIVAVPVGKKAGQLNGIYKLNKEGKELFELLANEITVDEIIGILEDKYEDDKNTLQSYVGAFIDKLKKDGVLA